MHSSFVHFGHLHVPVFGVFVALGLMGALALSQWSAGRAGLESDVVWNAGMTAVIAAFVISRLLLVIFNLRSFMDYPLLLLAVPSLTTTGVLLTAAFMYGYMRWRGLSLLRMLDSFAPPAALLWAAVNLGYMVEGTRDGMPLSRTNGGAQLVESYTLVAAVVLIFALIISLRSRYEPGEATGLALAAAGLAIFFIDFYRLPSDLLPELPLDPAQILATAMTVVGGIVLYRVAVRLDAVRREEDAVDEA